MDLIDSILSIVPLMMLLLFIFRVIGSIKKKKDAEEIEEKKPAEKSDFGSLMARLGGRSPLTPADEQAEHRMKEAAPVKPAPPPSPQPVRRQLTGQDEETRMRYGGRERLADLPELKKALVWAEILGKPKGLD